MDLLVFDVGLPAQCTENSGIGNIQYVGFAWGVSPKNIFGVAPIQVDYFRGDQLTKVLDSQNLIDVSSVTEGKAQCMSGSEKQCLTVTVNFTPRQKLDKTAILVQLWDGRTNVSHTRFNHGMQFDGKSLNPDTISKTMDGRHLVTLISSADEPNKAIDQYGNHWSHNKKWVKEFIKPNYSCSATNHGYDRYCKEFARMMKNQESVAQRYFDASDFENTIKPFTPGHDYPDHPRYYESQMFKAIAEYEIESVRQQSD